jgi:hypothetical protein
LKNRKKDRRMKTFIYTLLGVLSSMIFIKNINAQAPYTFQDLCEYEVSKNAQKNFEKALKEKANIVRKGLLATVLKEEPDYPQANY